MERSELIKELQVADECITQMGKIASKCPRHYVTGMPQDSGQKATLQGFNTLKSTVDTAVATGAIYDETRIYVNEYGREVGREYSTWASNAVGAVGILGLVQDLVFSNCDVSTQDALVYKMNPAEKISYFKGAFLKTFKLPIIVMIVIWVLGKLFSVISFPVMLMWLLYVGLYIGMLGVLFKAFFNLAKGLAMAQEQCLLENDTKFIEYAERLSSLSIIQNKVLPANALNHRAILACIKKLQAGQANSIAECFR